MKKVYFDDVIRDGFLKEFGFVGISKISVITDFIATATEEKKETLLYKYLYKFLETYQRNKNNKGNKNNKEKFFEVTEDEFMALNEYCNFLIKVSVVRKKGE